MDINDIRGITTLIFLVTFIGIWIWAWSKKRSKSFSEAENLPFSEEEERIHQKTIEEANK